MRAVSVAMSAGAGCGKTHVLTQRFLSHLEPVSASELSSLVAITYTERAAREMRDRIRQACRSRLQDCPPQEAPHWLRMVREIDTARVSTIHSFCGSLLRSQAVEAGLDPRFGVLEETAGGALLDKEIRDGFHELLVAENGDAIALAVEFGPDRAVRILETLVPSRFRIDFSQWTSLTADELAERWERKWYTESVPQLVRDLLESEEAREVLALLEQHEPDGKVMQERRTILLSDLPELARSQEPGEAIEALLEHCYVKGSKAADWPTPEIYEQIKDGLAALRDRLKDVLEELDFDPADMRLAVDFGLKALRVTEFVGERYDRAKRDAALLDFDDLLLLTRNLLRDNLEVRRRIANGISLLMVDEFQDTDPLQTDIVRFLCGDQLTRGKLFLVGDAKQSIYRFRRAEPRVFHQLRQEIPQPGRLPLSRNFRSQPEILNFVNALFDGALGDEYEPLTPAVDQLTPTPCIEFLFTTPPAEEEPDADAADEPAASAAPMTAGEAGKRREAEWVALRLASLLKDGVPRIRERDRETGESKLRPVEARDIVILFRAMSDVRFFEAALRDVGLDYYVVGGRAFYAQQEVFDLANLCQALDDPDDEVSLLGVLRSPFFSLTDDSIYALRSREGTLSDALQGSPPEWLSEPEQDQIRFAGRVWQELRAAKDRLAPAELLNLAVSRTGYDASLLLEFLGARKLANLSKLIELARQFDRTGLFTLSDFVDRLREAVVEEAHEAPAATHPESSNVLRLMSIHQSKGLEFPVVVVADMDRRSPGRGPDAQLDPEFGPLISLGEKFGAKRENPGLKMYQRREQPESLAETLRLLYVATTRAADFLILSAHLKKEGQITHPWMKLLASRFDLQTGQPRMGVDARGVSPMLKYGKSLPQIHVHHEVPQVESAGAKTAGRKKCEKKVAATSVAMRSSPGEAVLSKLREVVLEAAPAAPPPLWEPIEPDSNSPRGFSISRLEKADAEGTEAPSERSLAALLVEMRQHVAGEELSPYDPFVRDDADQLGTLVHAALERMDLKGVVDPTELVRRAAMVLPEPASDELLGQGEACLRVFLQSTYLAELRSARRIFRELELLLPWPAAVNGAGRADQVADTVTGVIDCIYETPEGEWVLLDYKTGVWPDQESVTRFVRKYQMQMTLYAVAVERWLGRRPDRVELVGLRGGLHSLRIETGGAGQADVISRTTRAIERLRSTPGVEVAAS